MCTTSYLHRPKVQILLTELILPEWGMHIMQEVPYLQLNWLSYLFSRLGSRDLDDGSGDCVCKNSIFINQEGKCVCPNGTFVGLDVDNQTICTACPNNCLECTKINNIEQCTSCR
jgi:hypothetical protein